MRLSKRSIAVTFFICIAFAAGFGVRAMDASAWAKAEYRLDDSPILATHDAYAWLAGARGVGVGKDSAMADLVRGVSAVTGTSMENVAFWMPAVSAGLLGVVLVLFALALGAPEAGLTAGVLASFGPALYLRTRLGYYDTDIVTLLFPMLNALLFTAWLSPWLLRPVDVFRRKSEDAAPDDGSRPHIGWPFAIGVSAVLCGGQWHLNILDYYAISFVIVLFLVLVFGQRRARGHLLLGLCVYALAAFNGWWGLGGAAIVVMCIIVSPRLETRLAHRLVPLIIAIVVLMAVSPVVRGLGQSAIYKAKLYTKASVVDVFDVTPKEGSGAEHLIPPAYPSVTQSIIEATNVDLSDMLMRLGGLGWYSVAGLLGFVCLLYVRPTAWLLLPLVGLSFLSVKFGSRFAMFGGAVVALGFAVSLGLLVTWLLRGRPDKRAISCLVVTLAGALVVAAVVPGYLRMPVTPVISSAHAKALRKLETIAPKDATVWTWWDYGYATMYYSGLMSFADGGRHSGRYLYPLARVLATPWAMQAAQVTRYAALYGNEPWKKWDDMDAEHVRHLMGHLGSPEAVPTVSHKRYLVVTWENIPLASWIIYYGTWDPVEKKGVHGQSFRLRGEFQMDFDTGRLVKDGKEVRLATVDELSVDGRFSRVYPGGKGHLVLNHETGDAFVMDEGTYLSMMVQLLLIPPRSAQLDGMFRLVYEDFPNVRIYEVL